MATTPDASGPSFPKRTFSSFTIPGGRSGGRTAVGTCFCLLGLLLAARICSSRAAESVGGAADMKALKYCIIVTGGELLEGVYPDAHTPFLTRLLRPLGCQCVATLTVDDNREDIQSALSYATNRAPLVIVTGGLGPTPNDITRETIAEFTSIPLREDPEALAEMERRFRQGRDQLRPNLRRQTWVPQRGRSLKNSIGTAVGLVFDSAPSLVIALPGPPKELQPMAADELVPFLRERFGVRRLGTSLTLRFVGAGQSLIDQTIKDHVAVAPDVMITSLFEGSRVDFTFALPGDSSADRDRLRRLEQEIREHLAEYIYADDGSSLEDVIVAKLNQRDGSLTLVEIGSSGSLAAALSGAKGSASVLTGGYVGATESVVATLLGLAPEQLSTNAAERVQQLAASASAKAGSKWALGVGPVDLDGNGSKAAWVVWKAPGENWATQRLTLRNPGEISRTGLTTQILDSVRRWLK